MFDCFRMLTPRPRPGWARVWLRHCVWVAMGGMSLVSYITTVMSEILLKWRTNLWQIQNNSKGKKFWRSWSVDGRSILKNNYVTMTATFLIIYFCKLQVFRGNVPYYITGIPTLCKVANIDLPSPGGP